MRNILLTIEYVGTQYHGWQIQPNGVTIQGEIERSVHNLTQHRSRVIGASRTDAGVHAINQRAHFITESQLPLKSFIKGLNHFLPKSIRIKEALEMSLSFHAKRDAQSKTYQYWIHHNSSPSAMLAPFSWHIHEPLDIDSMNTSLSALLGTHDFSAFRASDCNSYSTIRTITEANTSVIPIGNYSNILAITMIGNAFLKHMVRNIVGTVVDVGLNKLSIDDFKRIFDSRDRTQASQTAPAKGLFLMDISLKT